MGFQKVSERSKKIIEALPNGILMIDSRGRIVLCNEETERLFRYTRQELEGEQVEILVPERFRGKHPEYRQSFFSSPQTRAMGAGRDLFGRRKDGSEFPVEIGLNPMETDEGLFVLASVVDISERKAAEDRFRAVVESAPNGLVITNERGDITLVNAQAEHMFGYDRREMIGKPVEILVPLQFREYHPRYRQGFFKEPKTRPMGGGRDLYGQRKDGSQIPVEIGLTPLEIDGKPYVLAAVVDITERKKTEAALRESEQRFRLLVEGSKDYGIFMLDPDAHIASWNLGAERIFGYAAEEVLGKPVSMLYQDETLGLKHAEFELRIATEKGRYEEEGWRIRKDGRKIWINVIITPLREPNGEIRIFSKVIRDITERKEIEEKLMQTNADLQQKNEEMEQFIYTVSHDLKSPIVTSMSFIQYIREDLQDGNQEDIVDSLGRLERANHKMVQLIDDLLRLSRVGRLELKLERIDVTALVREICEDLRQRMEDVCVEVEIQDGMPYIIGDRTKMSQLFENLLTNAMKYGAESFQPKIWIGSQKGDGEIRYFVRDNGPGIAPEYHKRIFGLFERLETTKEGTGVGLAIVKRVVDLHGGRVWVESSLGQGATFWLALPSKDLASEDTI